MSESLVPYAQPRLSRKRLREWLEGNGPVPVQGIVPWACTQVPGITKAVLQAVLEGHPNLFACDEHGAWSAVVEEPKAVSVRPRPRPKRQASGPKRGGRSARGPSARSADPPKEPPSLDEIQFDNDRLVRLVIRLDPGRNEPPYESGSHYLVPLPQEEEMRKGGLDRLRHQIEESEEPVELFEIGPGGVALFRGTRPIVRVGAAGLTGRLHLLLGPASDDESRLRAKALRQTGSSQLLLPAPRGGSGAALVRSVVVEEERLSEGLVAAAAQPSPVRRADRAAAGKEINQWLHRLHLDASKLDEFRDWFIRRKVDFDQELIQQALERLVVLFSERPDRIFRIGLLILDETAPQPGFAAQFAKALARRSHDAEARAWAFDLLPAALEAFPADEELELATARLQSAECRVEEAASAYAHVTKLLEPGDWSEYLYCAGVSGDLRLTRRALAGFRERIEGIADVQELRRYQDALGHARDVAIVAGESPTDWSRKAIRLHLALDQDRQALSALETIRGSNPVRWEDKLDLASLLEEAGDARILEQGLRILSELVEQYWGSMSLPAQEQAIAQLRCLEGLLPGSGPSVAQQFEARISRPVAKVTTKSPDLPLRNRVVAIVGGRPVVRQRVEEQLRALGAMDVRQVAPSFEEHFSEAVLRPAVAGAHFALELTDCVKHDALMAIRNLQAKGLGFVHIPTQGGPSRVVRDLLARVSA